MGTILGPFNKTEWHTLKQLKSTLKILKERGDAKHRRFFEDHVEMFDMVKNKKVGL